ncbi:protein delta homolog 1-like [Haliotis rubra]|uniref:protein delta homolog 1-like n=1 Tax=Haliotis rubra TaxID=36100 RepID=UPI001EE55C7F|nr:protein delta homolog 1-like [Haliotis rubra]
MQLLWITVVLGSAMFVTDVEAQNCVNAASCSGHGVCPNPNFDVCSCTNGYSGDGCARAPVCTSSSECGNGGTCITNSSPYVCSCAPGYSGLTCQNGKYIVMVTLLRCFANTGKVG